MNPHETPYACNAETGRTASATPMNPHETPHPPHARDGSLVRRLAAGAVLLALAAMAGSAMAEPPLLGARPAYVERVLTELPNAGAIVWRAWAPGLEEGYVPQGVAVVEGGIVVSAYAYKAAEAPGAICRLYRVDPQSGAVTGVHDVTARCGHAGGIAYAGGGRLFIADTGSLIEIDAARAFAKPDGEAAGSEGAGAGAVVRQLDLQAPLRGSFLAYGDGALWIGEYRKPGEGRLWRVPLAALESPAEPGRLGERDATGSLPAAEASQGAAFDAQGRLWLTQSSSQYGRLQTVDPADGRVLAAYAAVAGIEGLDFDREGMIWTVSEAGAKRWLNWPTFAPLLLRIDPARLR